MAALALRVRQSFAFHSLTINYPERPLRCVNGDFPDLVVTTLAPESNVVRVFFVLLPQALHDAETSLVKRIHNAGCPVTLVVPNTARSSVQELLTKHRLLDVELAGYDWLPRRSEREPAMTGLGKISG